ncbi:MAG: hypothetical protein J6A42_04250 [Firmicutes bacterium]|nr:hypothetical protein [Bacillota bacterium]
MKKNNGFSSIYVILCLSSLVLFLLCTLELCSGYAAGSICENVCLVAGKSVLSEYQPDLQRRYGIFAVSSYPQKLGPLNAFYIRQNLNGTSLLVRPKLTACEVSCEETQGLDVQTLASQIDTLGLMMLGKDALDESGALELLKEMLLPLEKRKDKDAAEQVKDIPPPSGEEQKGKSPAQLMKEYDEAMHPDLGEQEGRSLVSAQKEQLPSRLLDVKPSSSLLKYAVSALMQDGLSPGALLQSRYTVSVCSNLLHMRDDTVLGLETEYVLFGRETDRENETEMKEALFKIRMAVDLASNLRNETKLSSYAAAAAAFPAVPQPLAVLLLAAIDAAVQAKGEVQTLCSGGFVAIAPGSGVQGRFGTYRDYALLLLLLLPQQTRLARLMDVMQVNVAYMDGSAFAFRDYCYGFLLHAEFEKKSFLPVLSGASRRGTVEQAHVYR